MNSKNIAYWATTGLVALAFVGGGAADLSRSDEVMAGLAHLGYPLYFATILGIWKILGAVALVAPGLPRLKEWAYAGIFFDLSGAAASHAASGDDVGKVMVPLVILGLTALSWALRPAGRRLEAVPAASAQPRAGASATPSHA